MDSVEVVEALEAMDAALASTDAALDALAGLVKALKESFSEYGVCCFVTNPDSAANRVCGEHAHYEEFRPNGKLYYCDAHAEQRPDPRLTQQLPHAPALRIAQRVLKEAGRG